MRKKFEQGLDAIIQPTTAEKKEKKATKKPEYINSNIPLLKEQHLKLRMMAIAQGKTLKALFPEIIQEYLDTHKEDTP